MLSFLRPVFGFAGGSGFRSAISMNLIIGTSLNGTILLFAAHLYPK